MFNTNNLIKFGASVAGALLIFLFAEWGASAMYRVAAEPGHGDEEHAAPQGYVIAAASGEASTAAADTAAPEQNFADVYAAADAAAGEKVFKQCKACHKLEAGANGTGPSLHGVVDRPAAEEPGFSYSDALVAIKDQPWSPEHLNDWLTDPKAYAPGNKMTFKGLKKIEDRANLIAYLATNPG